jgi:hypothetical protein
MTLPRLYAMTEYWAECPPAHIIMRSFIKVKSKKSKSKIIKEEMTKEKFEDMKAVFGSFGRQIPMEEMLKNG